MRNHKPVDNSYESLDGDTHSFTCSISKEAIVENHCYDKDTCKCVCGEGSTYSVSFDANGGDGAMAAVDVEKNSSYTLSECAFTASGCKKFLGWAASSDGDVINGERISVTADTTLYAIWRDGRTPGKHEASGNDTIIDSCQVCNTLQGSVTLSATDVTYSGSGYRGDSVTATGSLSGKIWEIAYAGREGTPHSDSSEAPSLSANTPHPSARAKRPPTLISR